MSVKESCFEKTGVMIDCSRNSVLSVQSVKKLIDVLSKMGYDSIQLYTEDTFEVNNEPYFGYLRGRYTKAELKEIEGNDMEIEARFCRSLSFGTGGLRGILGAGTNRMNIYTVRKATQGLAEYILEQKAEKKGVAIAFDSRNMSPEFAEEAALTLAANKIRAYVFPSLRPTPMLSFAVRELGCTADDFKEALRIAKDFRINITKEQRSTMARAYECIVHPDFYRQIGTDIPAAINEGVELVKKLYGNRSSQAATVEASNK